MEKDRIIHQGDTAKYQVEITHPDFDQQIDPFRVVIHANIPDASLSIDRSDMLHDEDGNFFMLIPTTGKVGVLKAECHYTVPDSDFPETGTREEVDIQFLAFVTDQPCPCLSGCCSCTSEENSHVRYTRIYRNDARSLYLNVRTADKEPVHDANGQQIRVRKENKDIF